MRDGVEVTIRPMEPADADAAAGMVAELGYQRTAEQVRAWLAELSSRSGQAVFVAVLGETGGIGTGTGGAVVGWIDVSIEHRLQTGAFGLIGGLVVKSGVRGAGIGRQLCQRAEQWVADQGLTTIRVTSRSTREAAHRFYLRDGYRTVKTSLVFDKTLGDELRKSP